MEKFSIKKVYVILRGPFQKVPWRKVVCNNFGAAKWIFILRLIICEKLLTRDRLATWGITEDTICPLCNHEDESIAHLFFKCVVSSAIWKKSLSWQGIARSPMEWQSELQWVLTYSKGNSSASEIYWMCLAGTAYQIWKERNTRVFQQRQRSIEAMVKQIVQEVHGRGATRLRLKQKLDSMNFYP
ncbi:uncharacterized protein LOC132057689 [Lycium ferocissimum]|uniref:uncharacterized protein LOC132057689 n=1 Tax=Lycium ferocissimum TaxID=112874 RepID=UPI002815CD6F|nr:uncharacterized protein LOC132057689 [Lycium ferocissimum]